MANLETFGGLHILFIYHRQKLVNFSFHGPKWAELPDGLGPQGPGCYELDVPLLGYERRSPWGMPKTGRGARARGWPHGASRSR